MASFLINDQYWPGNPWFYKYTNLLIHIIIGLVLFILVSRTLKISQYSEKNSQTVALFVSAIWLVHPLNISTTLYVIQRMTQLMMLFSVLSLLCFVIGRSFVDKNPKQSLLIMSTGVIIFGALSILSKENGVLVFLYIIVIEFTLFHKLKRPLWYKVWITGFIITPITVLAGYFLFKWPSILNAYQFRDFNMIERLLTEARILCEYLYLIIIPQIGGTGLIHDDVVISTNLFSPITTLLSIVTLFGLLFFAIKLRKQHPIFTFGVLWFFVGHALESTFIALELYFEHRNYMPMVGPLLALSYYACRLGEKYNKQILKKSALSIPALFFIISALLTYQSTNVWANPFHLYAIWAAEHPHSLRAQRMQAQSLMIQGKHDVAIDLLKATFNQHPHDISLPLAALNAACQKQTPPPYSPLEIIGFSANAKYTGGLVAIVKNFITLNTNRSCPGVTKADMHNILTAVESVHGLRGNAMAELLLMHSDIYILDKQLSPAIEILDKALLYQNAPVIPARQARLLASAGLYDEALRYIAIAKKSEHEQSPALPSQMHILNDLEANIIARAKDNL
ncbi:MAG: hypothetical protein GXP08_15980 [Gammaproteobacteria bacterium]|nr:hypothetical protein [Gammaproteobacteria bacterium]